MELVLCIICHKFSCTFSCIFCISKILKTEIKFFEKKKVTKNIKSNPVYLYGFQLLLLLTELIEKFFLFIPTE